MTAFVSQDMPKKAKDPGQAAEPAKKPAPKADTELAPKATEGGPLGVAALFRREEDRSKAEQDKGLGKAEAQDVQAVSGLMKREEEAAKTGAPTGLGAASDEDISAAGQMMKHAEGEVTAAGRTGLGEASDEDVGAAGKMMKREEQEAIKAEAQRRREQKAEENKKRKEEQLAKKDTVHAERAANKKEPSEKDKARKAEADKYEAAKPARAADWEKKVKAEHALGLQVKAAYALLDTDKVLTNAVTYSDKALNDAHTALKSAMDKWQWTRANELLPAVKTELAGMKPHVLYFKTLIDKRLPWLRGKLGASADATLAEPMAEINGRFALDRDGLAKLERRLDSSTYGTTERTYTAADFDAVKNNETEASNMIDTLLSHAVIRSGGVSQAYRSSWDHGRDFSVEYTILGLPKIVIHAHCDSMGRPKEGNGTHWKLKTAKFSPGASHPVSATARAAFLDPAANVAEAKASRLI